ncbi:hypothetical protein CR513_55615, partial [Mucuna pruriens]
MELKETNREIQDIVKVIPPSYKVDLQLKRRNMSRNLTRNGSTRGKERRSPRKDKSHKKGIRGQKEYSLPFPKSKNHGLKREWSESSQKNSSSSSEVESSSDGSYYEGDLLMVKRLMSNLVGEEAKTQR